METKNTSGDCCTDQACDSGRRNRYYPNKRVTPDTYQVEQDYHRDRRLLLNRAIHGWGVVYGFRLGYADANRCSDDGERRLSIGRGLALDPCGRELLQTHEIALDFDDLLIFDAKWQYVRREEGKCRHGEDVPWGEEGLKQKFLLRAHYAERLIAPVAQRDPCECERQEWDQTCETVRYSLTPVSDDCCCKAHGCDLDCECLRGPCCPDGDIGPKPRGGCRCLCEYLTGLDPNPECCTLTTVCKNLRVDLRHGVPLACVTLKRDDCGNWTLNDVHDACGPRRLVKRNDLLFDLIRGCDLTRVEEIGWAAWHRKDDEVPFGEFAASFEGKESEGVRVTRDYWVRFSKPVQVATIGRDCFTMTAILREFEGGWGELLRVPIGVQVDDPKNTELTDRVYLTVDSAWLHDAISDNSRFEQCRTRIEITIRGDYILDCNGQAVDANARGRSPAPTGNGVPGDTYVSTFLVQKKQPPKYSGDRNTHTG